MNDTNSNNKSFLPYRYGQEYSIYYETDPEFFTTGMCLPDRSIDLLFKLANAYRHKTDDEIICELREQKKLYRQALSKADYDVLYKIQTERQNLTNAYALNHGVGLSIIKQISMLGLDNLQTQFTLLIFFNAARWHFYYNLSKRQSAIDYHSRNTISSYLRFIEQEARILFKDSLFKQFEYRDDHHQIVQLATDQLIENVALCVAEDKVKSIAGKQKYEKLCDSFNNINRCIRDMKKDCQFPPYGVALSINYEDDGQRVLPWSGNLSESQIIEIRKMIHELGGDKPADICRAILAAYCRLYFNDEPSYKQVMQEFYPVYIDPGFYCREVSNKIKGTRPKKLQNLKKNTIKRFNPGLKIWVDCRNEQMIKDAIRCEKLKLFYDRLESGISQF